MRLARGIEELPKGTGPTVVTIGVFDGVHRGHQTLMRMVTARAAELGATPAVVTFDPHPLSVVAPGKEPQMITSVERRAEALEAVGIELMLVLRFDEAFRALSPQAFVETVLVEALGCVHVVTGSNFRFGYQHAGTIETLNDLAPTYGFGVTIVALLSEGEPISSSLIRREIADGNVERASEKLGRAYRLDGVVEHGAGRGKGLGIPTANLAVAETLVLPKIGVYAGWLREEGRRVPAVINVGLNPTFETRERPIVEVHALDYDADLYGKTVGVEFTHRLRDERKFDSAEALVEQIHQDIAEARRLLPA